MADIGTIAQQQLNTLNVVLLRYPKLTPKPRFFAKPVHHRNLGFSAVIDGFWAHLHAKIIYKNSVNFAQQMFPSTVICHFLSAIGTV